MSPYLSDQQIGLAQFGGAASTHPLRDAMLGMGPVGLWLLDEAAGVVGVDLSGNGNDGTYTQAAGGSFTLQSGALPPSGQGESTRFFNPGGVSDRAGLFVPHAAILNLVGPGTVVAWQHGTFGTWNGTMSKFNAATSNGWVATMRDGQNFMISTINAGSQWQLEGQINLDPTAPHLIAARWGGGNASIWADGVKIAEILGGFGNAGATAVQLEIGSASPVLLPCDSRQAFSGLYSRALSDSEMALLWSAS